MRRHDDLASVYGLLQKKSLDNLDLTRASVEALGQRQQETDRLLAGIGHAEEELGAIRAALDIPMPTSNAPEVHGSDPVPAPRLRVSLSPDMDFHAAFDALAHEARMQGFTDLRADQLLSQEGLRRAREHTGRIDAQFQAETGLREKDLSLLMILSAVKMTLFLLKKAKLPAAEAKSPQPETVPVDAMLGVDLKELRGVRDLGGLMDLAVSGDALLSKLRGREARTPSVLDEQSILEEPVPFDVPDNRFFSRSDVLGYDPILGWLFGAMNFMTGTVTTSHFRSYAVSMSPAGALQVDAPLSTSVHVLLPVIRGLRNSRDAIIASMIREAGVLNITPASHEQMACLMTEALETKSGREEFLSYTQYLPRLKGFDPAALLKDTALTAFADTIGAALCAVRYNAPEDGPLAFYAVRMHKILTLSHVISALGTSLPAIASGHPENANLSGLLSMLLSLFHSADYWTRVKAEYLASEYRNGIRKCLEETDRYFENPV